MIGLEEIFNKKIEPFGLDVSDSAMKLIQIKKTSKSFKIVKSDEALIPKGIIERGEIKKSKEFLSLLKEFLKGNQLKTAWVCQSLPEEHTYLRVLTLPSMEERELKEAVKWEAEGQIPISSKEAYIDFSPISRQEDHWDVLTAAMSKAIVKPYLEILKEAGFSVYAFEPESLALVRALIKRKDTGAQAILDLGQNGAVFCIFSTNSIRFSSFVDFSGSELTRLIKDKLKISLEQAENKKKTYGLRDEEIKEAILPNIDKFIEKIKEFLEFYKAHDFHEHKTDSGDAMSILLSGGGSSLPGFSFYLEKKLNVSVRIGNPWINVFSGIKNSAFPLPKIKSLSYTTAIGLALKKYYENGN